LRYQRSGLDLLGRLAKTHLKGIQREGVGRPPVADHDECMIYLLWRILHAGGQ
jgi:hypothetical protein